MKQYIIHTDGGSRGNPGPAAVGIIIDEKKDDGTTVRIEAYGETIGVATNNVAEYTAVSVALSHLHAKTLTQNKTDIVFDFYLDSLLVVQQLNGVFKVKDPTLQQFVSKILRVIKDFGISTHFTAVRREYNKDADLEVNKALDLGTS